MREDKDRLVCDIPSGDFPGRVLPPLALLCALLREGLWPTIKCQFRGQVDDPATFRRMIFSLTGAPPLTRQPCGLERQKGQEPWTGPNDLQFGMW